MESLFALITSLLTASSLSLATVKTPELIIVDPIAQEELKIPQMELVSENIENIFSVHFDDQKNAYLLRESEKGIQLSFQSYSTKNLENLGELKLSSLEKKSLFIDLSPQNVLYITWIRDGEVHLAKWSEKKQNFTNIEEKLGSTNISGNLKDNLTPKVSFDINGKLYLSWLHDPTRNIPSSFHTQSLPHHDFYITTWDDSKWLKVDGRPWFERLSDYFPVSLSIEEYDITFDSNQNPIIAWTRKVEEAAFEDESQLYITRYIPNEGWKGFSDKDNVWSLYLFSNLIENPLILYKDKTLLLGLHSTRLNNTQIESQVYKLLNNKWISISPAVSPETQRFLLQKKNNNFFLIEFRIYNLITRMYTNNRWETPLKNKNNRLPYQRIFPLLPKAKYFFGSRGESFLYENNKLWQFPFKKEE